jgi:hypothetical protein
MGGAPAQANCSLVEWEFCGNELANERFQAAFFVCID